MDGPGVELSSVQLRVLRDRTNEMKAIMSFTMKDGDLEGKSTWTLMGENELSGRGTVQWRNIPLAGILSDVMFSGQNLACDGSTEGTLDFQGHFGKGSGWQGAGQIRLLDFALNELQTHKRYFQADRVGFEIHEFDSQLKRLDIDRMDLVGARWEMQVQEDRFFPFLAPLDRLHRQMESLDVTIHRLDLTRARVRFLDTRHEPAIVIPLQIKEASLVSDQDASYRIRASMDNVPISLSGSGSLFPLDIRLKTDVRDLPLGVLALYAPRLQGQMPEDGSFTGQANLLMQADASGYLSTLRLDLAGDLQQIDYRTPNFPVMHMDSVTVRQAGFDVLENAWNISGLGITGVRMTFRPGAIAASEAENVQKQVRIADMEVEDLSTRVEIDAADRSILLPDLDGKGHLEETQGFTISLAGQHDPERWDLKVRRRPGEDTIGISLSATGVPLVRLRHMVPRFVWLDSESAPELGGEAGLDLDMRFKPGQLRYSGKVNIRDLLLGQAGKRLEAAKASLTIEQAGVGVRTQHISRIVLRDWIYQAPLSPFSIPGIPVKTTIRPKVDPMAWRLDRLALADGLISVGSPEDVWFSHVDGEISGFEQGKQGKISLSAAAGGGGVHLDGSMNIMRAVPEFTLHLRWRNVLPFFANDWLHLSGMPRLLHGRLSGSLQIRSLPQRGTYKGDMRLSLLYGRLQSGTFPHDPMLKITGYASQSLFDKLLDSKRNIKLDIPIDGSWLARPLNGDVIASALTRELRQRLDHQGANMEIKKIMPSSPKRIASLRLRKRGGFTLNERIRLARIISLLRRDKHLIVELEPQLGAQTLNRELFRRVRENQSDIERYLHRKGVDLARIFPVWPDAQQRGGEISSIRLIVRSP
jgi:hypothetical protein